MLEYSLIIISTILFGGQFIALNAYQDKNGKSYRSILLFCSLFSLVGAALFLCLTGFKVSFSWYTLMYAGIASVIQLFLQIVGIKALAMGRVEIYSLFNVAGGMSVAYIFGVTYFKEPVMASHIIGLILVLIALLIPIIFEKSNQGKSRFIFWILCFLVFIANGFFGSVNKIHIVSGIGLSIKEYMFYMYLCLFTISSLSFLTLSVFSKDKETTKGLFKSEGFIFALIYGLVNSVGMFLQYSFADKIPASILFPLSNGGCIVFGLIIGCIYYRRKPKLPDIIQLLVATLGMVFFIVSF